MRVVCQPRAWRLRHGDLPRQGAGHVPCRMSVSVPRRHVALGCAVGPTARAPSHGSVSNGETVPAMALIC